MKKTESREFFDNLKAASPEFRFDCNLCDVKMDTLTKLKNHERFSTGRAFSLKLKKKSWMTKLYSVIKKTLLSLLYFTEEIKIVSEITSEKEFKNYSCFSGLFWAIRGRTVWMIKPSDKG